MRYYIISGEPSGDLHGSNLIKSIKKLDSQATIRAWGGDLMQTAGADLAKHYRDLAFMGIWQVLKNLGTIRKNFRFCEADIQEFAPDTLILIDYSGFNLRIARWAKEQEYKVIYYISPQVWATREKRVRKIKQYVDKMFVILPFEKEFYAKHEYPVEYVGHPLLDVVQQFQPNPDFRTSQKLGNQPIIALLPGSRKQEILAMLNVMLSLVPLFPDYQFVIAGAPSMPPSFYQQFTQQYSQVTLVENQTYDLLSNSHAALVTSGTATLETALFKVPQVVCYKASALLYHVVKRIIKIPYIAIVNLIVGKEIVKELIQHELNTEQLQTELSKLLEGTARIELLTEYDHLHKLLGSSGASDRAAKGILDFLENKKELPEGNS
ncbi:MAG: lipid-A-disaccharide synthase [Aureispira sp.]|nr:lipid-A-disaccharide synthase [Aureispira sp.]